MLTIFTFHRILESRTRTNQSYYTANIVTSLPDFIKQIDFIKDNFKIISFDEYIFLRSNKQALSENLCILTFDDGFSDFYQNAFPVLKKWNLPATMFLVGKCLVDPSYVKWLDTFYYLLDHSRVNEFVFEFRKNHFAKTKCVIEKNIGVPEIKKLIRYSRHEEKLEILDLLSAILRVKVEGKTLNRSLYLSEIQIREMTKCRVEFGAHSMTHQVLTSLTDDEVKQEIRMSVDVARSFDPSSAVFAYPFGGLDTYNASIIDLLNSLKINAACTSIQGINSHETSLFELCRLDVNHIDIMALSL